MQVRISNSYGTVEVSGTPKDVTAVLTVYSSKILHQALTEAEVKILVTAGQVMPEAKK